MNDILRHQRFEDPAHFRPPNPHLFHRIRFPLDQVAILVSMGQACFQVLALDKLHNDKITPALAEIVEDLRHTCHTQ